MNARDNSGCTLLDYAQNDALKSLLQNCQEATYAQASTQGAPLKGIGYAGPTTHGKNTVMNLKATTLVALIATAMHTLLVVMNRFMPNSLYDLRSGPIGAFVEIAFPVSLALFFLALYSRQNKPEEIMTWQMI